MLSIAILDDNKKALADYNRLIPEWLKKNQIKGEIVVATSDYKEFLKEVKDQRVNLCILDINLHEEINGLYIAKYLRKEKIKTEIIFCTGMLDYISQAFDVGAYNFISKPLNNNLEKCLVRLSKEIDERETVKSIIEIRYGSKIYYVPVDTITHFQRIGSKTIITTTGRDLETYDSLETFILRLNDNRFVQCHRSTIINKDFLDYVDIKTKSIRLTTGFQCEIGSKFYPIFMKERVESYVG